MFGTLALLPQVLTPFQVRVAQQLFLAAGLSLAWSILGGFAGYWSFGHAAFVGIGAFAAGLVATRAMPAGAGGGWDMVVPLAAGGLTSGAIATLIAYPLLRLRGIGPQRRQTTGWRLGGRLGGRLSEMAAMAAALMLAVVGAYGGYELGQNGMLAIERSESLIAEAALADFGMPADDLFLD